MTTTHYFGQFSDIGFLQGGVDVAAKATILFVAAIAATRILGKASAAVRHRIWCLAFCGVLLLPALSVVLPQWRISILPADSDSVADRLADNAPAPTGADAAQLGWRNAGGNLVGHEATLVAGGHGPFPDGSLAERESTRATDNHWSLVAQFGAWIWVAGTVLLVAPLLAGSIHATLLRRGARQINDLGWTRSAEDAAHLLGLRSRVRLLMASRDTVPVTWGVLRPTILLPATCDQWSPERRRYVLLHEFAHVKRLDLPWQWIARVVCVLYWFHPLAWYALHRLRIEREQACDDCVIFTGEKASDYASELVDIAETYCAPRLVRSVAMARSSKLEGRLRALFDQTRSHSPLNRRASRCMLALVLVLTATVAAVRPVAATAPAQQPQEQPAQHEPDTAAQPQDSLEQSSKSNAAEDPPQPLNEEQVEAIALRNLKAIVWAIHSYADANDHELAPAYVPNDELPLDKRLSGLVLLLPYLGVPPSYITEDNPSSVWDRWRKEMQEQHKAAKELHATIDLTKAWDDPANLAAAKTLVPAFVTPSGAALRDEHGYAVSHFAFVRGSERSTRNRDDGPFPLVGATKLAFSDIEDGTVNTLGVGQIHDRLGPWIAAGPSTSRLAFHPSVKSPEPTFGSQYEGCAYFATCDAFTFFFDMASTDKQVLADVATRAGREFVGSGDYYRFSSVVNWKKSRE